jgi:uncharacterized protein YkwD
VSIVVVSLILAAGSLEQSATSTVRQRFETAGRRLPADDAKLNAAARALAKVALERSVSDAAGLMAVTEAVSSAGGWDANPTAIVVRGTPEQLLAELENSSTLTSEPASVMGIGAVERGDRAAICVLLAERKFELGALPRRFAKAPKPLSICGALAPPFDRAELFVTAPSGVVVHQPMAAAKARLCGTFAPAAEGRFAIEVLARGPKGPEVAALFFVDVGAAVASVDQHVIEPRTVAEGRQAVLARVNGLRTTMGLTPLEGDRLLDGIAQSYAERMAKEGFFAHVDPQGGTLKARLSEAGYRYAAAGENLGASSGPIAAHFGIEHSPGHRANVLEPAHRAAGIGIALRPSDGNTVLVEVFAAPLDDGGGDPVGAAYAAIDRLRAHKKLPPLKRNAVLEALAQEHARLCLERDLLKPELTGGAKLHDRVFETVSDAKEASVDLAVLESPSSVPVSKSLSDARYTALGVGLVRGDSETYGPDKIWLVVIYANQRAAPE